jgi:cholesterol transport system auxiliary component
MSPTLVQPMNQAPRRAAWIFGALAALMTTGCALTSKSVPISPRYFSPERPADTARSNPKPSGVPLELRLGRISSSSYLDERLVFRDTAHELGYYEERRWTEEPEEYLRRLLGRVLFEERGLRHVVGGIAPTLEVELIAFEEIRTPKRVARVQLTARLQEARLVRWEETLTVDQPISEDSKGDDADAMVAAIGAALGSVVDKIADHVMADLATIPPPAPLPALPATRDARRP